MDFSRRQFIKATSTFSLSLAALKLKDPSSAWSQQIKYLYRDWEDLYKKKWTWDKVVKGTHPINCWYQIHCNWNIYVKEGIVFREEQAGEYPQVDPNVPDFNPRGCQKGCLYSQRMYEPIRIKYPLKRAGERGEGKWKRISWDDALTEIADTVMDVITKEGSDTIVWDVGTNAPGHQMAGLFRTAFLLDTPLLDDNPEIGDDHQGVAMTFGKAVFCNSGDDWFHSNLILIWGGNPFFTHIPNTHFILEARYNGTKVVAISPDYMPSAIHADQWIPVNVGSDAAMGLGLAHVIVKEKLYNEDFLKEQTDFPLLVRQDTRKYLREKDMEKGGKEDYFYFFDLAGRKIEKAVKNSLALGRWKPSLEGEYEVETLEGKVKVRPVFELIKKKLEEYPPEKVSQITGGHPSIILGLARDIARAKAVINITQSNFTKFYHGDLMGRAAVLVFALCGHFGKKGSGFQGFPIIFVEAMDRIGLIRNPGFEGWKEIEKEREPEIKKMKKEGYTDEMISLEFARKLYPSGNMVSSVLFWYIHGELKKLSEKAKEWDPHMKKGLDEYVKESLERGWQFIKPFPEKEPRILFEVGGNMLRRVRGYPALIETLLPKLKLIVTMDWRMSSTGLYSDIILPCAGLYEKLAITAATPIVPFQHVANKAIEPLFESKPEWDIFCLMAKKIQQRSKERGISVFKDMKGEERRLDALYNQLTCGGYYKEGDDEKLAEDCIKLSPDTLKGVTLKDLQDKGFVRYTGIGDSVWSITNACDIKPNETVTHLTWHTEKKIPYPTLTRRMQFYIDQELYMEQGEELPTYKEPPHVGGNYPLVMTGGHTRWSIHTLWRDNSYMLRLNRGVPLMLINDKDGKERGIKDGDEVEVKNDIDSFRIMAKVAPYVKPGQVIIYHAWENFQFKDHKGFQNLMPTPFKPTELAGEYFHLRLFFGFFHPGHCDRDTRVEVIKIKG